MAKVYDEDDKQVIKDGELLSNKAQFMRTSSGSLNICLYSLRSKFGVICHAYAIYKTDKQCSFSGIGKQA